jgi:hypothetical protein
VAADAAARRRRRLLLASIATTSNSSPDAEHQYLAVVAPNGQHVGARRGRPLVPAAQESRGGCC